MRSTIFLVIAALVLVVVLSVLILRALRSPSITTTGSFSATGNDQADEFHPRRQQMVMHQIAARGIRDERLLAAMRQVPRHRFIPASYQSWAYSDQPVPIGQDQTISQPYIVAYMTAALDLQPDERVLEIGTGSGYQAAILAELAGRVYTIEIVPELGRRAAALLAELGYNNIRCRIGDGYKGWPDAAPYDAIIVTAAPPSIPAALVEQLAPGGRMVVPVGAVGSVQHLVKIEKDASGQVKESYLLPVRFVPMVKGTDKDH
ncbi:MAG: protein-L-isoaspartate(D-aspartate) O-methyltransferase [Acidobacteria bacterium]|nr:protein-L-isoaspartate(D-aspartate) O-methyltransferase [Acidobacteriota bacterium]